MSDEGSTAARITALLKPPTGRMAAEELLPLVYEELRKVARAKVARLAPGHTLRPTELVHEAWMRVVKEGDPGWEGRAHFFGAAANAMRNILVEQARRRRSQKRAVDRRVELPDDLPDKTVVMKLDEVITLHEALQAFERDHERAAKVVELHCFAGLKHAEIADILEVSVPTIERDWKFARAWLADRMGGEWRA